MAESIIIVKDIKDNEREWTQIYEPASGSFRDLARSHENYEFLFELH